METLENNHVNNLEVIHKKYALEGQILKSKSATGFYHICMLKGHLFAARQNARNYEVRQTLQEALMDRDANFEEGIYKELLPSVHKGIYKVRALLTDFDSRVCTALYLRQERKDLFPSLKAACKELGLSYNYFRAYKGHARARRDYLLSIQKKIMSEIKKGRLLKYSHVLDYKWHELSTEQLITIYKIRTSNVI